jgi:hypothetical protein
LLEATDDPAGPAESEGNAVSEDVTPGHLAYWPEPATRKSKSGHSADPSI